MYLFTELQFTQRLHFHENNGKQFRNSYMFLYNYTIGILFRSFRITLIYYLREQVTPQ